MLDALLAADPDMRQGWLMSLKPRDREQVFIASESELGTPYGLWQDDPTGFIEVVLGQSMWSLQRKVAAWSARFPKVAVPSCVNVGKTFVAAALVLHHGCVWPPGVAQAVTTATRARQVQRQLWPELRAMHKASKLPGTVDLMQWRMDGVARDVAYGFTAPAHEEAAVQGIHAPKLLVLIDEGGGIARQIGQAFVGLVSSEDVRLLVIGNPPTDDEASWFESLTQAQDTAVIRIDGFRSPKFTQETTDRCRSCPVEMPEHPLSRHLLDPGTVAGMARDHGTDSPFYQAKVRARFPKGGASRVLPYTWLEAAREPAQEGNDYPRISHAPSGEPYRYQPRAGAWIRLGVDVAADGGGELAIARMEGDVIRVVHTESGPSLANSVDVAGIVLKQIREAQNLAYALGTNARVRVKIDSLGVGQGAAGVLEAWGTEGIHDADIVFVQVSESVEEDRRDDTATLRPRIKRDELWLASRSLLQPDERGRQEVVLDVDDMTLAQLGSPRMGTRSDGTTVIESKKSLVKRGLRSPDRAEAVLLSVYEPFDLDQTRRRVIRAGA